MIANETAFMKAPFRKLFEDINACSWIPSIEEDLRLQNTGVLSLQGLLQELGSVALHASPDLQVRALGIILLLAELPEFFDSQSQPSCVLSLVWQKVCLWIDKRKGNETMLCISTGQQD